MSAPPNEQLYVGVELCASSARAALINPAGEVLASRESALAAVELAPQIARLVSELRDSAPAGVAALGVGVPGLVNPQTGRVVISSDIPSVVREDLRASLAEGTGLPVALDNDANAAALGEYVAGAGRGSRNMFYVTIGTGIGGALILDGRLWRGASGFAGEFGHITIDPEGIECACGNIGCLETIASGPNIVRRTRERLYRDRTSSLSRLAIPRDREFTAEDIARAAREGDEMAQVMMERTGMFLGIAIAAVINLLNVEMVVMGGGVMEAGDLILKPTIKETRRRAFPPAFDSCEIVIAELGPQAGMIGAALLARDQAGY